MYIYEYDVYGCSCLGKISLSQGIAFDDWLVLIMLTPQFVLCPGMKFQLFLPLPLMMLLINPPTDVNL